MLGLEAGTVLVEKTAAHLAQASLPNTIGEGTDLYFSS